MLDNIISVNSNNDTASRTAVRAPSAAQGADQQPAAREDRGFSRHYETAQARSARVKPEQAQVRNQNQSTQQSALERQEARASQAAQSGNKLPANHSSILPVSGNFLPPDADNTRLAVSGEQSYALEELPSLPEGVSISIEVMQEIDADVDSVPSDLNELALTDEEAEALRAVLQAVSPGVEDMPESVLAALRDGGLERLRELVLADMERKANLDASAVQYDDAEDGALAALLASLQTFIEELELDSATDDEVATTDPVPVDRSALAVLSDDQRALLKQWAANLVGNAEDSKETLASVAADSTMSGLPSTDTSADTKESASGAGADDIEQAPTILNTVAALAAEAESDADTDTVTGSRKPGSESSQGSSTSSAASNLAANVATAGNTNNLVTDEATLVRQPMDAAVVRENIARQDTEALIKQHLERELPVRNSATEVTHRLTERLVMMVSRDIQTATIRLDPPDLGKLDIRITTTNEQVQVQVVTHQPVVRDLLEQHAHRLREMLEQQGFAKVDVNVSDQSQQDRERAEGNGDGGSNGQDEEGEALVATDNVRRSVGLVDHYV
ncbi:flagellar hook-length control protein FliK [Salinispirillum sp. LH 10-3-1]|uniref:Flagellar hook-length control protein FliK n=1 Tax=Salinispirillum sp. LH 10-3-1 TaxID=2952525 RepID=A0AB38YCB7_9GAMM